MPGATISIDPAVSGFQRYQFARAIMASVLVLIGLMFGGLAIAPFISGPPAVVESAEDRAIFFSGVIAFSVLLFFGSILVSGWLFGITHRRVSALIVLLVALAVLVATTFATMGLVGAEFGLLNLRSAAEYSQWQGWALAIGCFVAAIIALETIGWAWWQLALSRRQFFAARGWRAPARRVLSMCRQILGLPGFISNFGRGRMVLTVIYFLVAVLNLGIVALAASPLMWYSFQPEGIVHLVIPALLLALFFLNIVGLGSVLQKEASRRATRLYQQARDWDARPPVVFLRAFDQDAARLRPRSLDPLIRLPAGCSASPTIDELLLENASVYGPVVAIGDPRDPTPPLGAARIFVQGDGNNWQNVVSSLVAASSVVVMCPSTSDGVKWELDLIADGLGHHKVIFIANPLLSRDATQALFARIAPAGQSSTTPQGQYPVAAYLDAEGLWRVLTTKRRSSVQTYSVALNYALQSLLGMRAIPMPRSLRSARSTPA